MNKTVEEVKLEEQPEEKIIMLDQVFLYPIMKYLSLVSIGYFFAKEEIIKVLVLFLVYFLTMIFQRISKYQENKYILLKIKKSR